MTTTLKQQLAAETDIEASTSNDHGYSKGPHGIATAKPSSGVAANAVFSCTELLEHILFQLPNPADIMIVRRVDRNFRDTIEGSLKLQRKSLFQQENTTDPLPRLKRVMPGGKYALAEEHETPVTDKNVVDVIQAINPSLLEYKDWRNSIFETHSLAVWCNMGEKVSIEPKFIEAWLKQYLKGEKQSYDSMQLTQPPCKEIRLDIDFRVGKIPFAIGSGVSNEAGVTFGHAMRILWDPMPGHANRNRYLKGWDHLIKSGSSNPYITEPWPEYYDRTFRKIATGEQDEGREGVEIVGARLVLRNCVVPEAEERLLLEEATREKKLKPRTE